MESFNNLEKNEREMLIKFPVYISLLAINNDEGLDAMGKKSAIKFSNIKTYSCDPLLQDFYKEVDRVFEKNITELDNQLPKDRNEREHAIKSELRKLEKILMKMGDEYILTMHLSMKSFKDHVSKAHRNVLEYFIFPVPINGITD